MRDDFTLQTKELLAKRVGYRCSNPGCRQPTSGPRSDPEKSINVGFAAHISAAAPGGPRYDEALTPEQRKHPDNGVWVCGTCAKLIDNDANRYTRDALRQWKTQAERQALMDIEQPRENPGQVSNAEVAVFPKMERLMPDLLKEMRTDLAEHPLRREFVVLKRGWIYSAKGEELVYYYDEHPELNGKLDVLENCELIHEITYNNTLRYKISEDFADYLTSGGTPLATPSPALSPRGSGA